MESAVIGELALPVEEVYNATEFNKDGHKYWNWTDAYGERPDTSSKVEEWYDDTFLQEKTL